MDFGLVQEQRLKLVMTPELRQAIQILQFSATDLHQYIQEQMTENPMLELTEPNRELSFSVQRRHKSSSRSSSTDSDWIGQVSASSPSLAEVLEEQLFDYSLPERMRKICQYLIYSLDERGYLDIDSAEFCKRFQIGVPLLCRCIHVIQAMEPAGVGARSLAECIVLQLQRQDPIHSLAIQMASDHLQDIAEGRWGKIAQALQVDVEEARAVLEVIRKCNPYPGTQYSVERPHYIFPDVIVESRNGEFVVSINESTYPDLTVSSYYQDLIRYKDRLKEEEMQYAKNMMQSALWLVKGIKQRKDTMVRVSEVIVSKQNEFFCSGIDYVKPLNLKQVAEQLQLHESTISRATQNKYMETPHGLFPFRFFFPSGLPTSFGEELSTQSVKSKIQQIIQGEDHKRPLSDQKISNLLRQEGIQISRRTVAKYREEMGIAASIIRKRTYFL
ncbi:RNA polymerase RpoN-/SigL-like sigma 54 subunit [Hazenella coriacea]|uniref:RNA polymerase RpoN-/SigL-like sigma 54 subunit n=2 Tax=Hazenella coriacea TaxID=1179467 RepID=A0A4R3L927_9BACL|nr:RNA polymerase RpoN-/SigL-like sigma 54 subunit [Hazenella coriacea]